LLKVLIFLLISSDRNDW